jgi:hypothetical protein
MSDEAKLQVVMRDRVMRAICRERCAAYGEPPCHEVIGYTGDCESDEDCRALALAAIQAMEQMQ